MAPHSCQLSIRSCLCLMHLANFLSSTSASLLRRCPASCVYVSGNLKIQQVRLRGAGSLSNIWGPTGILALVQ
uniref:Secreted protein n=1 Tax=Kalanchoe fedtschenkoi TaxID=63787 RepID=A0A7N0UHZ9_KALFE